MFAGSLKDRSSSSSSSFSSSSSPQFDYFSLPISHLYAVSAQPDLQPDETPLFSPPLPLDTPADPTHPLLALRLPAAPLCERVPSMATSKLMQFQTAAAYSRPQPQPLQQHPTSSAGSADSNVSFDADDSIQTSVRCCRCHRTMSAGLDPAKSGFVSFGTNLYYCSRCASLVGYNR